MNADLTFNSVAFKKSFDTKDESLRRSTTRDINLPDDLIIRSRSYTDSATKVEGIEYLIRFDRVDVDAENVRYASTASVVIRVPSIENSTDLGTLITTFKAAVADADLIAKVLNNEK